MGLAVGQAEFGSPETITTGSTYEFEKVFVESEDNPDDFKQYPKIVVCTLDPGRYIYPMMIKLENSNIVKLESLNNYIPCILRLIELVKWSMDLRLRRKRQTTSEKGKVLIKMICDTPMPVQLWKDPRNG